jgi:hypothetical protein
MPPPKHPWDNFLITFFLIILGVAMIAGAFVP